MLIFNDLEEEIVLRMGSAMFGPPGPEQDRTGLLAKTRTLGAGWILYAFVRAMRPETILEIGAGGSTACLLWGLKHNGMGHIHTCDIFSSGEGDDYHFSNYLKEEDGKPMNHNKADVVRMIKKWGMEDICTIHHESSRELLKKWDTQVDMVVIDGDHSKEGVENDIKFLNFIKPGGYGFFHDFFACLYEVGSTVKGWVKQSDEWSLIVEPNCLSLAIVQRKWSIYPRNCFTAIRLTRSDNPNGAKTPIQLTAPRNCNTIIGWNGDWFQDSGFHESQPEGEKIAEDIMSFEKRTGSVVQSMEGWGG